MKKIAILCGGFDEERALSLSSATVAEQNLANRFKTYKIVLSDHAFNFVYQSKKGDIKVNQEDFTFLDEYGALIRPTAVLMLIHGEPGSSGHLLAYFELLKIPFTCSNSLTAGLFFNKRLTNLMASALGIDVPASLWRVSGEPLPTAQEMQVIGFPAIVKPVNGGFSLGVSCVTNFAELPAAIEMALKEDTQFLVESFITGREIAIGVMRTANGIIALPACEVRSKNGFISHQDKISASFEKIVPAALTIDEQQKLNDIAKKIYQLFECKGVIRVDFILKNDGRAFLLEINTVPGMASLSIIPAAVKTLGWTLEYFFTQLIENAPIS